MQKHTAMLTALIAYDGCLSLLKNCPTLLIDLIINNIVFWKHNLAKPKVTKLR